MKTLLTSPLVLFGSLIACQAGPSVTIYNQNFATVRDGIALDLTAGTNDVRFTDTTAHVEEDSVILRDPTGAVALRVLEQNYRADPVSEGLLLSLNEGKEIDFFIPGSQGKPDRTVKGKIIRSGYTPHSGAAMQRYGNAYYQSQMAMGGPQGMQPIIEVGGQLQFGLPGRPFFPALADDTVLKPTLVWKLHSDQAAKVNAEVAYVTGGMSWEAAYNVVAPEQGDLLDLTGWVTMDNQTGKTFRDAKVQLVAGDVAKVANRNDGSGYATRAGAMRGSVAPPKSAKSPSTNITSTVSPCRRRCMTGKPNRWNLSAQPGCRRPAFLSMMA